jgi:RNA polymerase sigma-70 factor (ECF subfamily)
MCIRDRFIAIACLFGLFAVQAPPQAVLADVSQHDFQAKLNEYSELLSAGEQACQSKGSVEIKGLTEERRAFYREYFDKGLVADLDEITSEFFIKQQDRTANNQWKVLAVELVSLRGHNRLISAADYPPIQAARWALNQETDANNRAKIQDYITRMESEVEKTIKEGFEISFILQHEFWIKEVEGKIVIHRDEFTDKNEVDNPTGLDMATWEQGKLQRGKVLLELLPEALIYSTPIEELGQGFLTSSPSDRDLAQPNTVKSRSYSHSSAVAYANYYSSNPATMCPPTTNVPQNKAYYNSAYNDYECLDCANFVSQALYAGGIPTNGTWYVDSSAWINVNGLVTNLQNTGHAQGVLRYTQLAPGDIATTSGHAHVAMVTGVSPYRYGGHTSDRKLYPWTSALVYYYDVY